MLVSCPFHILTTPHLEVEAPIPVGKRAGWVQSQSGEQREKAALSLPGMKP